MEDSYKWLRVGSLALFLLSLLPYAVILFLLGWGMADSPNTPVSGMEKLAMKLIVAYPLYSAVAFVLAFKTKRNLWLLLWIIPILAGFALVGTSFHPCDNGAVCW